MQFMIVGKKVLPYDADKKGQVVTVFPVQEEPKLHEGDRFFFIESASRRLGIFSVKRETEYGFVIRNESNPKLELNIPNHLDERLRTAEMPLYQVI